MVITVFFSPVIFDGNSARVDRAVCLFLEFLQIIDQFLNDGKQNHLEATDLNITDIARIYNFERIMAMFLESKNPNMLLTLSSIVKFTSDRQIQVFTFLNLKF